MRKQCVPGPFSPSPLKGLGSSIHILLSFDYFPVDSYILVHVISWTAACPGTHGEGLAFDSILSGQSGFTEAICFNNIHSSRGST